MCSVAVVASRDIIDEASAPSSQVGGTGMQVVFGPARDGGYYLLGLTAVHPLLFQASWAGV